MNQIQFDVALLEKLVQISPNYENCNDTDLDVLKDITRHMVQVFPENLRDNFNYLRLKISVTDVQTEMNRRAIEAMGLNKRNDAPPQKRGLQLNPYILHEQNPQNMH